MDYKNSYSNLTIGSDPEVFVKGSKTGKIGSIIGVFNADKNNPQDIGEGCFIQEDNILAEFNIPPCRSEDQFVDSINYAKSYIELLIAPLNMDLHYSSSELATDEILEDEKAHIFGCEPAYNVIAKRIIEIDQEEIQGIKMRSSGFHIHFGWDNPTENEIDRLAVFFEICVSLPLLLEDNDDHNRRKFYGKIGDIREKDYGVECRSLGGYFLKDEDSVRDIYRRSLKAVEMAKNSHISTEDLLEDVSMYINPEEDLDLEKVNELLVKYNKKEKKENAYI